MKRKQLLELDSSVEEEIGKMAKEGLEKPKDIINNVQIHTVDLPLVIAHENKVTKEKIEEGEKNEEPTEKGIGNGRNIDKSEERSTPLPRQKRYTII